MAKLSAHGKIVGTVEFTVHAKRYMSDGTVLVNNGPGWRIRAKLKPDTKPEEAYARQLEKNRAVLADRPALAKYREELHDLAPLSKRWKLHAAVQMMPDDPDGVWSEACDSYSDNVEADVDEIAKLCRAYRTAMVESRDIAKEKAADIAGANPAPILEP